MVLKKWFFQLAIEPSANFGSHWLLHSVYDSFLQMRRLPTFSCAALRQQAVSAVGICWVSPPPTAEICQTLEMISQK